MNASDTQRITITVDDVVTVNTAAVTITIGRDQSITVKPATANPTTIVPAVVEPAVVEPATAKPVAKPTVVEPAIIKPAVVEPATAKPAVIEPPPYRTITMAERETLVTFVDNNPPNNWDEKLYYNKYQDYCKQRGCEADHYDLIRELNSRGYLWSVHEDLRWKKF